MLFVFALLIDQQMTTCKTITIECSKEVTSYCSISSPSINLSEEDTFHVINSNYYLQPTILEIRPQIHSHIASISSIFDYFPKLEQLFISNCLNNVLSMRNASSSLLWINVRNNFIRNVTKFAFDGAPSIEHIDLSNNLIHSIEEEAFSGLDRLISIQIENNRLRALKQHTFTGAKSLSRINLRNNLLAVIADGCFALKSLEELILAENRLEIVSNSIFNGAERLKSVTFAHNKIKVINLIAVVQSAPIEVISLEDNKLGWYEKQSINCVDTMNNQLKNLNIAKNKLKNRHIFKHLKCLQNMEMLNLNANNFTQFENVSDLRFYFPHLSIIYLIDNWIKCEWLNQTLEETTFDTSLFFTRSKQNNHLYNKTTINQIECVLESLPQSSEL